jgi:hypothetical protein
LYGVPRVVASASGPHRTSAQSRMIRISGLYTVTGERFLTNCKHGEISCCPHLNQGSDDRCARAYRDRHRRRSAR